MLFIFNVGLIVLQEHSRIRYIRHQQGQQLFNLTQGSTSGLNSKHQFFG